jgi:hypothetical protein
MTAELRVYAGRPAPDGAPEPPVRGRPHTFRHAGRAYWLVAAYSGHPARALDALLFHADRHTRRWQTQGWPDDPDPATLTYELWRCDAHGTPRGAVARITDTTLTAARGFVDLLAHRSLDAAVSTWAAIVRSISDRTPRRITTLHRTTETGEHLTGPAQGTT